LPQAVTHKDFDELSEFFRHVIRERAEMQAEKSYNEMQIGDRVVTACVAVSCCFV
jgi:hypothetical protein